MVGASVPIAFFRHQFALGLTVILLRPLFKV
jgi:hypothetical protein